MWAGLFAAPLSWAAQHVFNFGVATASCSPGGRGWGVPVGTWVAIATAVAGALTLAGLTAAVLTLLAVRGAGDEAPPPEGRIYFLSICGIVISPIFLAIILMDGIATQLLTNCQQG
jgi:hypothetical protein